MIRLLEQPNRLGRQRRQVSTWDHNVSVRIDPGKDWESVFGDWQQPVKVTSRIERATRRVRQGDSLPAHFELCVDPHLSEYRSYSHAAGVALDRDRKTTPRISPLTVASWSSMGSYRQSQTRASAAMS
jgi:hypothetical protein